MDYCGVFKELARMHHPRWLYIKEFDESDTFSWYIERIAIADYETDPNGIILYFPKESDGVKLEDFVKSHPHAQYFTLIDWEFIC